MPDVDNYLDGLAERLSADGCSVSRQAVGDRTVVVGYKAQMRACWPNRRSST
jgi:hypothetical protein